MLKAIINGKHEIALNKSGKQGEEFDLVRLEGNRFHVIKNSKSYNATLISSDLKKKKFTIRINGNDYEVQLKDKYDLLLKELGMSEISSKKINQIKAPMPGLVVDVLVKVGDTIKKGDSLMVLEAMKMENILKAPGEGKVSKINQKKGETVEKNMVLIELE